MKITICENKIELGKEASYRGAYYINKVIKEKGECNVAFITGLSQIATLHELSKQSIDWNCVNVFLLDEYIGIDKNHSSSSLNFLTTNLLSKISKVKSITSIDQDDANVNKTLSDLNKKMEGHPLDVSFVCIGENGHLALNDPPANLYTNKAYIKVELDNRSRKQQVSEGWFKTLDEVPKEAITLSIPMILSSKYIICSCPDQRKAKAVASCLFDDLSPFSPAASLKQAKNVDLFLDRQSSCLILSDRRPK